MLAKHPATEAAERLYRQQSGRILATLIRILGDFDLAEELLQDAITAALHKWPEQGIPRNPQAWVVQTARNRAVDLIRRRQRFREKRRQLEVLASLDEGLDQLAADTESRIGDDQLRLIFTCCHPALALEAQVALTLRTLCGFTTD